MSNPKHTSGPWLEKYGSQIYADTALNPELNIATANRMSTRSEQEANARLIAAAPELLEALQNAAHRVRWLMQFVDDEEPIREELRTWGSLVAKAMGETQ